MLKMMENLLAMQCLQMNKNSADHTAEIESLRKGVPAPILAHYDRLLARGKKGVAILRGGVCVECHMRVPVGTLVTLANARDVQLCGNCGRYLYLSPEEAKAAVTPPEPPAAKKRKRAVKPAGSAV